MPTYKTLISTFMSGQLRALGTADTEAIQEKLTEIRTGVFSHHCMIKGKGKELVLSQAGKTSGNAVEECSIGLGGKWRLFFYRTGYSPRNTLELERDQAAKNAGALRDVPDGTLWCILIGHLEGNQLELYVQSAKAKESGAKTDRLTIEERDAAILRKEGVHGTAGNYQAALDNVQSGSF